MFERRKRLRSLKAKMYRRMADDQKKSRDHLDSYGEMIADDTSRNPWNVMFSLICAGIACSGYSGHARRYSSIASSIESSSLYNLFFPFKDVRKEMDEVRKRRIEHKEMIDKEMAIEERFRAIDELLRESDLKSKELRETLEKLTA